MRQSVPSNQSWIITQPSWLGLLGVRVLVAGGLESLNVRWRSRCKPVEIPFAVPLSRLESPSRPAGSFIYGCDHDERGRFRKL
jgi:hypothetical protein